MTTPCDARFTRKLSAEEAARWQALRQFTKEEGVAAANKSGANNGQVRLLQRAFIHRGAPVTLSEFKSALSSMYGFPHTVDPWDNHTKAQIDRVAFYHYDYVGTDYGSSDLWYSQKVRDEGFFKKKFDEMYQKIPGDWDYPRLRVAKSDCKLCEGSGQFRYKEKDYMKSGQEVTMMKDCGCSAWIPMPPYMVKGGK